MREISCDVVVLGGAFSGASSAILLRREAPELKVVVVEKAEQFDAKVGEATTEMSAMFLTRRLAMWHHLEVDHLPKEGLRYWFNNPEVTGHLDASESGGKVRSVLPAFQLRRDVLDEYLLQTAAAEGAELLRPARATEITLGEFDHSLVVEAADGPVTIRCRWIIDATGRVNVIGRKLGLIDRNEEHPTASMWCRWKGVRSIDDIAARGPQEFARKNFSSRRLATNHYMGFGYWIWVIPLGNGETSIGIVFDKRYVNLHHSRDRATDFIAFLKAIPSLAEILVGAEPKLDDFRFYGTLPYVTRQYMGRGWAMVGDAAAFIDPYYSPGLDHAAFSVDATTMIIRKHLAGENVDEAIATHNETFIRSYHRFFKAAYQDKYTYMGEHDLLTASFLIDTAQYYLFVVIPAYRIHGKFDWMPVLGPKPALISYQMMRLYNRRFRTISLARRAAGEEGLRNKGRRLNAYYDLGFAPLRMIARGLRLWALAELDLLRIRVFGRGKKQSSAEPMMDQPASAPGMDAADMPAASTKV